MQVVLVNYKQVKVGTDLCVCALREIVTSAESIVNER